MTNHDKQKSINVYDYVGGFLTKEDITNPRVVTIKEIRAEDVDGSPRPKLVAAFEETDKGLVLNSTNIKRLADLFRTGDAACWVGEKIVIYVDPTVQYAGKTTGGIRVDAYHPARVPDMPDTDQKYDRLKESGELGPNGNYYRS